MSPPPEWGTSASNRDILNSQQDWWDRALTQNPAMFGNEPSQPAKKAVELFKKEGVRTVLELGAGTGRDTKLFGVSGYKVCAVDYSPGALETLAKKAKNLGLSDNIDILQHDIRQVLPFPDNSFDACYSHMLFCMALTEKEQEFLAREIRRVLKPGGLCIYTVRHKGDAHFGAGAHRGEDMYELNGFVVNFFDRAKVERLADGFDVLSVNELEEGSLPRRLFEVTLRKD